MKKILEKSGNFVRGKKWEPCKHDEQVCNMWAISLLISYKQIAQGI